ncbi:YibE/F-like protein [Corynebacterium capitovis DSM 44611]|uniref:YibE/F family protein n=1 Tax=Corynebacterium capitovis TaxID=131081 RepID=UPI0003A618D9|nr:YibE/F family protein [Corynebacterium capitovis]WKD58221.1 YibE/F-like protein [Corynebacterium capitovis DSM 44611]
MGRHSTPPRPTATSWTLPQKVLAVALLLTACATVAGLVAQWPRGPLPEVSDSFQAQTAMNGPLVDATVASTRSGPCSTTEQGKVITTPPVALTGGDCTLAVVDINEGPDAGKQALLVTYPDVAGNPHLAQGERIVLARTDSSGSDGAAIYTFQDFQRDRAMWVWCLVALALIVLVGGLRGALSLIGLAATLGVVLVFLLPALIRGGDAVSLALTTSAAVLLAVQFLVHGVNWKTASAMGGTLLAVGLSGWLSHAAVASTSIRGLGDEHNLSILLYLPSVDISGLMLAGMIIGALGVLVDVTIGQASTVNELYETRPQASPWQVFVSAMRVGHDHIASIVYTLVLSYTGVALPTLLLLTLSDRPIGQVLTSDIMATEILRSVTGAIALVLAVPLTTGVAAITVAPPRPPQSAGEGARA